MRTIWKFPLEWIRRQTVEMPASARILTVQVQRGNLYLWVDLFTGHESVNRRFVIVGTGNEITEEGLTYLATVQIDDFVWHIFEQSIDQNTTRKDER